MNKRPFVHLLKSPLGWYYFDVNKNEIVKITENIYHAIKNNICIDQGTQDDINYLESRGYLSENRVKEIEHTLTAYASYYLEHNVERITLQLTQNCNLRCAYCVYSEFKYDSNRSHTNKRMTFQTAKSCIDFLLEHSRDAELVYVSFYGGEPLLEFALLKKITEYIENSFEGKDVKLSITTNGTLLSDEVVDFLLDKKVTTTVSLDGPREIHNSSRHFASNGEGSYDMIIGNLLRAIHRYPNFKQLLSFNMVIDPQNEYIATNRFYEEHDDLYGIPIRSTFIDDIHSLEKITVSEEYKLAYNYDLFLAYLESFGLLKEQQVSMMATEALNRILDKFEKMRSYNILPDKYAPSGPCIPGQARLFVTVDGDFYPCEKVNEESNALCIGNVICGFNYEQVLRILNIGSLTNELCRNCWAINHCGLCAKHADNKNELSGELKASFCNTTKAQVEDEFLSMIMINEMKDVLKG